GPQWGLKADGSRGPRSTAISGHWSTASTSLVAIISPTQHLGLHDGVERAPSLLQLRRKRGAELPFKRPNQCFAERNILGRLHSETSVQTPRMFDQRLEHLLLIERADQRRDHVH